MLIKHYSFFPKNIYFSIKALYGTHNLDLFKKQANKQSGYPIHMRLLTYIINFKQSIAYNSLYWETSKASH